MYNSVFVSFAQHQSFQRIDKNPNNGFKNQLYPYTFELKNKTLFENVTFKNMGNYILFN